MKLLYCPKCYDMYNLSLDRMKSCHCGLTEGKYIDKENVEYYGPAVPLAIDNNSFYTRVRGKSKAHKDLMDSFHGKGKIQCWLIEEGKQGYDQVEKKRRPRRQIGRCGQGKIK